MSLKERGKPRKASLFFRLVWVCVGAACSAEHPGDPATPIQIIPNAERIPIRTEAGKPLLEVTIRIENTSAHAIVWSECALAVERNQYIMAMDRHSEEWLEVWRPTCPNDDNAQNLLRPGESASLSLEITPGSGANFRGEVGIYRVRFFLSAAVAGEYHQLSPELSVSRAFSVVDTRG